MTNDTERNKYAMMVLEYQSNQYAIEGYETGVSNEDLTWLAINLLQYGPEGLSAKDTNYLAHLMGTAVQQ
jgi:hypothetical protein